MIAVAREVLDVLVASVWQGAVVTIVVVAVLALAGRRLNAATRSIVWQGALAAIVIVPLLTTLPHVVAHSSSAAGVAVAGASAVSNAAPALDAAAAVARRIDVTLSDRAVLVLIGAWTAGVLAFGLRLGAASLQLGRLLRFGHR